ncbi:hypothetical protein F-liban_371 [Faustovirus]|nr:hypothetical protein F-liban_371 [Faustovirus]
MAKLMEVKTSSIPGANNGVFAKTHIDSGSVLFSYQCVPTLTPPKLTDDREYRFDVVDSNNAGNAAKTETYAITLTDMGGMINDTVDFRPLSRDESVALFEGKPPRVAYKHNCKFIHSTDTKILTIVASCDINAGDELFVDYGVNYWVPRYVKARYITGIASFRKVGF